MIQYLLNLLRALLGLNASRPDPIIPEPQTPPKQIVAMTQDSFVKVTLLAPYLKPNTQDFITLDFETKDERVYVLSPYLLSLSSQFYIPEKGFYRQDENYNLANPDGTTRRTLTIQWPIETGEPGDYDLEFGVMAVRRLGTGSIIFKDDSNNWLKIKFKVKVSEL